MNNKDFDYQELRKANDPWVYIEKKAIELVTKTTNFTETQTKLIFEQSKQNNILGLCLKTVRQKKRISIQKMAERMQMKEEDIKAIESGDIVSCPLGLILAYLNNLGHLLSFNITESKNE